MKVGLIGCGRVAGIHMHAYANIDGVEVVAVADLDAKRAKAFADNYRIDKVYRDYTNLLEIKSLDFVDICAPTSTHASISCDVAKSGHNILVEKPMATNTSDCERMIDESEKNGIKLCVCHNQLFSPSVMQVKSLVDSESFDLTSFKTTHKENFELLKSLGLARDWNVTPEEKGILWEIGCHHAYLQLYLLRNISEVYAVGNQVKYPVYDEFSVLLRTPDRRYGVMEISWLATEAEMIYEICSSDGRRVQVHLDHEYVLEKSQRPPDSVSDTVRGFYVDEKRVFQKWIKFGINYVRKRKLLSHLNLISNYIESLEKDTPPPVPPEDGRNAIKLLECIEESLNNQRPVAVSF